MSAIDFGELEAEATAEGWVNHRGQGENPNDWGEPEPLPCHINAQPYPIDALPHIIGAAVREVVDFVQCPDALAACSALSAASVAAQGVADVRRDQALVGPVSLYLLAVAESGERKSEADRRFTEPLREWERAELEALEPQLATYRAELAAWEAEVEGVKWALKQRKKEGEDLTQLRADLARLEASKPAAVRRPRLVLESETTESLAFNLARPDGWPSAGILSAEGGSVLGGYAMRPDTVVANLALLNKLWSGERYVKSRRTNDEAFVLEGARLTVGLAVQPGTLARFFEDTRGQPRDSGFAARFLIAWPESTVGSRLYKEPPVGWPRLTAFHAALRRLLGETRMGSKGLELRTLNMTPEGFATWRQFHDSVEPELRRGGDLAELRDVGGKAADHCARLAAVFHLVEVGASGSVSAEYVARAARVITWHLFEAQRFLNDMELPLAVRNSAGLDRWLIDTARKRGVSGFRTGEIMHRGYKPVRKKADLVEALAPLQDANRVRLIGEFAGGFVQINPALLDAAE